MKRDLANIDTDMFTPIGRLLQQSFAHGINCDIVQGGILTGQTSLQSVYAESETQNCTLGTKLREVDTGREFIYSQAGSVKLYKALMTQSLAIDSHYINVAQTAYPWAIGATSGNILISTGATPAANYFKDGWLVVNDGTGEGQAYPIATSSSHATIVATTLKTGFSVITAWPATAEVSLVRCPFKSTIVAPVTTLTAPPAGVPIIDVTVDYFFWAQVKGPCPMFVDDGDTIVIGEPVGSAGTSGTAGGVGIGVTTEGHYGRAMTLSAGGEVALINLDLGL